MLAAKGFAYDFGHILCGIEQELVLRGISFRRFFYHEFREKEVRIFVLQLGNVGRVHSRRLRGKQINDQRRLNGQDQQQDDEKSPIERSQVILVELFGEKRRWLSIGGERLVRRYGTFSTLGRGRLRDFFKLSAVVRMIHVQCSGVCAGLPSSDERNITSARHNWATTIFLGRGRMLGTG